MTNLIDGRAIAEQIHAETAQRIAVLKTHGVQPGLAFIRVGEDPASRVYVGMKEKTSELELKWEVVGGGFGGSYLLHLAVDRKDGQRMYAIAVDPKTKATSVLSSRDGGKQWSTVRGE